ncbi:tetratricopeptide repeat protein [Salibacteraceae bacterium]|nr:tetratricopeptide repeat protein [Salibacteraceae bacterium]
MSRGKNITISIFLIAFCCGYSISQNSLEDLSELGENYLGDNAFKLDSIASLLLEATDTNENSSYRSIAFNFDGVSSAMQGDLGPSLQAFQESWKIAAAINDTNLQVNALTNMAGVYKFAGQPNRAQEKLKKALELLAGESQTRANTLLALGIIQEEMQDYI